MTNDIRVNGARLWNSIMAMAEIGATANGGSHRLTLSDDDRDRPRSLRRAGAPTPT